MTTRIEPTLIDVSIDSDDESLIDVRRETSRQGKGNSEAISEPQDRVADIISKLAVSFLVSDLSWHCF